MDRTGWTIATIRKLTWFQICEIVFHARDKHDNIIVGRRHSGDSEEESFRERWRAFGLRESEIDHKWAEFIELECYRDSLERQKTPLPAAEIERMVNAARLRQIKRRKWGR